jgi:hypothetical protein
MDNHQPQSIVHQLVRTPKAVSNQMKKYSSSLKRFSSRLSSHHSAPLLLTTAGFESKNTRSDSITNCLAHINAVLDISSPGDYQNGSIRRSCSADIAPIKPMRRPSSDTSMTSMLSSDTFPSTNNATFSKVDHIPEKPIKHAEDSVPLQHHNGRQDQDAKTLLRLPLHTINQNDFMVHCLIDTSRPCLVHFFVEDSLVSQVLDRELGELHAWSVESRSQCRFMRMNANAAPFMTSKLRISTQDPSVVCIHNGDVFQRMIDPECFVQCPGAVKQWAMDTGLLDL